MAKRKREWNEGGDNLFSEANLAQMDAINQRLDEAIKERTEDGKEDQDRQIRANAGGDERGIDAVSSPVPGGDDAGGGGQISRSIPGRTEGAGRGGLKEIPGISSNQGGYEQRNGDRADGISSGLDDAQKDSERENIRPNLQRVDEYGRAVLPHDDNTQMVQAPGADGLQPGELERNRDGALDGSANSRERRIQSLFDSDSQTNEGGGQYGSGDTKSSGDQSLSGIHRDIANDENGQGQDISILQATPGGEGFYYVTSTGDTSQALSWRTKPESPGQKILDRLFAKDGQEVNFVDFKGFRVGGYYERTLNAVVFELENLSTGDTLAPSNLTYNQQSRTSLICDEIKFSGFLGV